MNFTTKKHNVFYYKIRKCTPLSKNHPTQRSSELTTLTNQPSTKQKESLGESTGQHLHMHKTGFHWQYFDKSRFITKKIQNRAYNTQKRRYFSCFYPKTSIKANIGTLKAISRTDTLRLSKKNVNFITVFVSISTNSSNL